MPKNTGRNILLIAILTVVMFGIFQRFNGAGQAEEELQYNEFLDALEAGEVAELTIQPENNVYLITGRLADQNEQESFTSVVPYNSVDDLDQITDTARSQDGLSLTVAPEEEPSPWTSMLITFIPLLLIFFLFIFLMSQAQGGGGGGGGKMMNFGKSKAKLHEKGKKSDVHFDDVAGADEEKAELVEVVDFLKDPRRFDRIGARIPKGVLLVGPPGTGKTLIARAVAGEAGVPFFSISGSDFVEMFVGVGASRVRDLFENAKKNAPCIIFIDEIDAVGRQRGAGVGGGHDEREQTLNQLLVEMDGFAENEGVIMIAATNRPDILDPALLRPGRFDRQIQVGRPDVKGREAVLKVHARNKPLDETVDLAALAQRTPGFSGADLENLLNEAALVAARSGKKKIDMRDVDEASDRVIAGPAKKSRVMSKKERNIVAYHEAGHTIIGMVLDDAETVHKVTIVPRGQAGGYAVMLPKEDRYFMTKPELEDKIVGLLGGRVSEEITFGEVSTGAHNDFQRTTGIARSMVTEYGMSDRLGPIQFGESNGQVFLGKEMSNDANYSDSIAYEIDQEMQNIVKTQYERCRQILTEHQEQLNLIAETLLEIETLDREQIEGLFYHGKLPERSFDNEPEEDETVSDSLDNDKAGASYEEVKDKMDSEDTAEENKQEEPEERPDMVEPPKPEGDTEDPSVDRNNDERNNR
ncbi:ATP-dependent zinc metalloprotease FtsH [Jeotgalicoccus halotolerans]|jgi:ATP-dependent metalloprotease FtsH|uniref:ATP-dependent zinc metalloprotease FtsH n=1 Tax=Jeotgalicoccus nanhaiensis TaxID=568603 RepID=A0ABR9Y053_9STAP|nr:ATP-dependent zinc metalloprotease FtsH [Jeotgalicoccus nanhaiensis]MBF0754621.1 ATP-dependent zinc metalloprotease FtsH [Jeotgalicoccus nanhaiensis]TFU60968.1 ATP-dependent metallopeptidase FtsH/Yme1/Tma family protein [Jeotgalicoccus nanhaiensis]